MKYPMLFGLMALGTWHAANAQAPTAQQWASEGLAAAVAYPGLADLCDLSKPLRVAGQRPSNAVPRDRQEPARERTAPVKVPTRVFDNLYFVGHSGVSSWALKTSQGIILIDAMNNNNEARDYIEEGLKSVGLDPLDIKYLVITHGHGDHYGGQEYLIQKYAPRVVMSDADWKLLEQDKLPISNPRWGKPPKRDITAHDGDKLTLGDGLINIYVTPGHTAGTLSLIFPVRDGSSTHHVGLWGGTGLNFGPDQDRLRQYAASAERFGKISKQSGVDIFMSNHPGRDGTMKGIEMLNARPPGAPHPFVKNQALGAFELLKLCPLAHAESLRAQVKQP